MAKQAVANIPARWNKQNGKSNYYIVLYSRTTNTNIILE